MPGQLQAISSATSGSQDSMKAAIVDTLAAIQSAENDFVAASQEV